MNVMRVGFGRPGTMAVTEVVDYIFHKHALLGTAQQVLAKQRNPIYHVEFFPGDGLTERDISRAIAEERFIGV